MCVIFLPLHAVIIEPPFLLPNTALVEQLGRIFPQPPAALVIAAWISSLAAVLPKLAVRF